MFRRIARLALVGALAASTLAVIGGGVAPAQTGPTGYTVGFESTTGQFDCGFYSIDMSTGEITRVTPGGEFVDCADGLTFAPDGTLYAYANPPIEGISSTQLVTIDPATGDQTIIGDLPDVFVRTGGMTFDAAGNLWLYAETPGNEDCDSFDVCLWQVDPTTAATTFVGAGDVADTPFGLAGNCAGEVLAITAPISVGLVSDSELQRVDTSSAALTPLVDLPDIFGPSGLDYDASEVLWALGQLPQAGLPFASVHQIDPTTGDATTTPLTVGGDSFTGVLAGLAISPISCPEPPPAPAPEVVLAPTFTG